MSIKVADAGQGHHGGHPAHEFHAHASAHAQTTGPVVQAGVSPLWWSVSQRLTCAAALTGVLWLVIVWAVA